MNTLEGTLSSRRSWIFACSIAGVLAVLTFGVIPIASRPLPAMPMWLTVFLTLAWSADALTSFLFVIQGRLGRSMSRLVLASAYAYSSLIIALHALVFPGVFSPTGLLGADTQSAVWFWVAWHGGFPLFVIAYAIVQQLCKRDVGPRNTSTSMLLAFATIVVAIVSLIAIVVLHEDRFLPILIHRGQYTLLVTTGIGGGVAFAIVAAMISLVISTRLRRVTDLWLTVAMFASLMDCIMTLLGTKRYTLGWDVARVESLVTSTIVLLTFLRGLDVVMRKLAVLSNLDGLTGIANRRAFDDGLSAAIASCARADRPLSVLMIDVDAFKTYNDEYGHRGGDEALRTVADCISQTLVRRNDLGARYGGEEFGVVLPMTDLAGAGKIAERIRTNVARCGIEHRGSLYGFVTVSIGVATLPATQLRGRAASGRLVSMADEALYRAKELGRNRSESSDASLAAAADEAPLLRLVTSDPKDRIA